ncbi:50S ribosomal protein L24 [Candidatus Roizmanbacteria bacterium RIFOXYB2_FULL_38_10]|uniref:Large ribosomal subunit protein uL24 n=1 Tax=Candidatus Roizmanbacteria bacterium RIFOXYD1_FULL_38_12 TaxID=1802093 RepID=A0A1F7KZW9_9BACT|nr:MAG: 50S ribosomal protein L24 [Candidatus Roizmanbacteria bacterium RIFOXYA2_FULL_38_14]OGK63395.1 MAG: 50S ribosomal protein L24 [Candidatus Roizmanbacteria bacterium RIFOXYA1_FULL_37_12]OGK65241.1 MAG: 50S ribosomal protein L24 [Candidatus Roizmanbacteria bacterium RIFOXYB1_FULL_40_23]OGK68794.1 MAG: 50S ribosomal protein L24 [Candidatus Roizmanbacteria bacterium RIFOXYB2_FULL_38_10]OGK69646.1 MAG: 50S ribosomal protein L24 [Candidatus Roizmanbacteria bacterium RIFOXYC1_FULL_38_14]OGK727
MKIKKGDKVKIITGKNNGKEGVVEKVYNKQNTLLIPGINLYKKHIRKNEKMPQGGVVEIPRPLAISKVMLICPKCKKPTRIGYVVEKSKKSRVCKQCKSIL